MTQISLPVSAFPATFAEAGTLSMLGETTAAGSSSTWPASGVAMSYTQGLRGYGTEHEQMTRMEVVRRLARLKGLSVSEEFAQQPSSGPVYLIPSDTLVGTERARALGIKGRDDL